MKTAAAREASAITKDELDRLAFEVTDRSTIKILLAVRASYGRTEHGVRGPDAKEQTRLSLAWLVGQLAIEAHDRILRARRPHAVAGRATFDGARVSGRLANCLGNTTSATTFAEIVERYSEEELLLWNNFGPKSLRELKGLLAERRLRLRPKKAPIDA